MFYGQAKHSIDAKGRVILPSKYRESLGESFFVLRGFEKCLFVYTEADYHELEAKIKALPISNDGGVIQRYIFHYTEQVTADKQGRFVIPPKLREFAGLDKDIIIAGASSRIEIWDEKEYEKYEQKIEADPQRIVRRMHRRSCHLPRRCVYGCHNGGRRTLLANLQPPDRARNLYRC